MATRFEDLNEEQVRLSAEMFWRLMYHFVYDGEIDLLVKFCTRYIDYGYALGDCFNDGLHVDTKIEKLFNSFEDFDDKFAELLKPLVLERVQEELQVKK